MSNAGKAAIVEGCLRRSRFWANIVKFHLTANMRTNPDQAEFAQYLLEVGEGRHQRIAGLPEESIDIPRNWVTENVINEIFPEVDENSHNTAILTPKNNTALLINEEVLEKLPGDRKIYYSHDIELDQNSQPNPAPLYPVELLHSLTPSGMAPHKLILKKGALIMLLRNMDPSLGLCNGTRLIIEELYENTIKARIVQSTYSGSSHFIPRMKINPSETNLTISFSRSQFPVRLAYAFTINKAQVGYISWLFMDFFIRAFSL